MAFFLLYQVTISAWDDIWEDWYSYNCSASLWSLAIWQVFASDCECDRQPFYTRGVRFSISTSNYQNMYNQLIAFNGLHPSARAHIRESQKREEKERKKLLGLTCFTCNLGCSFEERFWKGLWLYGSACGLVDGDNYCIYTSIIIVFLFRFWVSNAKYVFTFFPDTLVQDDSRRVRSKSIEP